MTAPPGLPPTYSSAMRIAQIVHWLHSSAVGLSLTELAERLGIHERTLARYVRALKEEFTDEEGEPLVEVARAEVGGRLRFRRKGLKMEGSAYELMGLYLALDLMAFLEGTFLKVGAQEALDRLQERLRKEHGHQTALVLKDFHKKFFHRTEAPKDYSTINDLLGELVKALVLQKQVRLSYQTSGKPEKQHQVLPLSLLMYKRALYLVARRLSSEPGKTRDLTFAVERILKLKVLDEGFAYPHDYDPAERFQNTFGLVQDHAPEQVRLQFSPVVAQNVASRTWHPSQAAVFEPDGSVVLALFLETGEEFLAWLLGYGPFVRVLEPPSLVEKIKFRLREALEQYEPTS